MSQVFRIEKNRNYTIMSNHHLRDKTLSLKAKGLLSLMLSLPGEWDYSLRGLAAITKEGLDSIGTALKELENHGYLERRRIRNENGKLVGIEYIIREQPLSDENYKESSEDKPNQENPDLVLPELEKAVKLNNKKTNTKSLKTHPISSASTFAEEHDEMRSDAEKREKYKALIMENVKYGLLVKDPRFSDDLEALIDLMTDTICSGKKTIRIAGDDMPAEIVRSRFIKLRREHIQYVLECLQHNTSQIKNIKSYLLTSLYNAPMTMNSYYVNKGRHDAFEN